MNDSEGTGLDERTFLLNKLINRIRTDNSRYLWISIFL